MEIYKMLLRRYLGKYSFASNANIRSKKRSKTNDLKIYINKLDKEEQN